MSKNIIFGIMALAVLCLAVEFALSRAVDSTGAENKNVSTSTVVTASLSYNVVTLKSSVFHFTWPLPSGDTATVIDANAQLGAIINVRNGNKQTIAILSVYPNTINASQPTADLFKSWLLQVKQPPAPVTVTATKVGQLDGYTTIEPGTDGQSLAAVYIIGATHIYSASSATLTTDGLAALIAGLEIE